MADATSSGFPLNTSSPITFASNPNNSGEAKTNQLSGIKIALIAMCAIATLTMIFVEINSGLVTTSLLIATANPLVVGYTLAFALGVGAMLLITRPSRLTQTPLGSATEKLLTLKKNHNSIATVFKTLDGKYTKIGDKLDHAVEIESITAECYSNAFKRCEALKVSGVYSKSEVKALDQVLKGYGETLKNARKQKNEIFEVREKLTPKHETLKKRLDETETAFDEAYQMLQATYSSLDKVTPPSKRDIDSATPYPLKPYQVLIRAICLIALSAVALFAAAVIEFRYGIVHAALVTVAAHPYLVLFSVAFVNGVVVAYTIKHLIGAKEDPLKIAARKFQIAENHYNHRSANYEKVVQKKKSLEETLDHCQKQQKTAQDNYDHAQIISRRDPQIVAQINLAWETANKNLKKAQNTYDQYTLASAPIKMTRDLSKLTYSQAYSTLQNAISSSNRAKQ